MSVKRFYRLRKPGGGFGPIVEGQVPEGVRAECEGVAWLQIPGQRMAVKGELWSEVEKLPTAWPPPGVDVDLHGDEAPPEPHTRDGADSALLDLSDDEESDAGSDD